MKIKYLREISIEVFGSIISAILISLSFFLISDFLFEPPNLNGKWFIVTQTDESSLKRYIGMKLVYEIMLFQEKDNIYGTAEKISEIVGNKKNDYDHVERVKVDFKGTINRKYFSKDVLYLHWKEQGRRRETSSYFEIKRFDNNHMFGFFNSTAAESNGKSEWVRDIKQLKDLSILLPE